MTGGQPSQDRLNQIAGRKLAALGVTCAVGPDGRLLGDLDTGDALVNPFTNAPVASVHFVVEAHDHMRFLHPPLLAGLPPLPFFDADSVSTVLASVAQQLHRRRDAISRLKTHLHHLRVEGEVDREHGVLVAPTHIDAVGTVVLIGDEQGLRPSHLRPMGGGANLPMPAVSIDLSQFADATDLSLFVGDLAQRAKPAHNAAPTTGAFRPPPEPLAPGGADLGFGAMPSTGDFIPAGSAEAVAAAASQATEGAGLVGPPPSTDSDEFMPTTQAFEVPESIAGGARGQPSQGDVPAGAVTAGMLARCLGDTAQLAHGVAVMRKIHVGGRTFKLTLRQKRGRVFVGRIAWDDGVLWQGELEVDKHPPMDELIYELLRSRGWLEQGPTPSQAAAPAAAPPIAPIAAAAPAAAAPPTAMAAAPVPQPAFGQAGGEQLPVAGEIWVMNVVVEQQDDHEVRYSAINAEGQPYGAPRMLPKSEFERVFAQHRGGCQLLVRVMGASPQQVVYVQLDPSYQPNSETRAIAPSIFLANFLPEAGEY